MKEEKLESSKEQLQGLLKQIETAQMESDEYQSHRHHHHHHHKSRSTGQHEHSGKHEMQPREETTGKESDIEALISGEKSGSVEQKTAENKVHNTQNRIRSGNSFSQSNRRRKRRTRRILTMVVCLFLVLTGGIAGTVYYMIWHGERTLREHAGDAIPELFSINTEDTQIEIENLDDNTLIYQDQKYRYNEDILNFLIVGIDTEGDIENTYGSHGNGTGQSDALLLTVMDNFHKKFTLIPINRDTITSIEIYDQNGEYLHNAREQIALSYAYGDGKAFSAELTTKAVSNLFYGLPIHGYIMVNIDAITVVNDMLGGVEVTLEEDYTNIFGPGYEKGNTVTLVGEKAEGFVRTRYGIGEENNAARMNQQRQYLSALIQKGLKATRADLTLPVDVYNVLTHYMITNITSSEVAYLASRGVSFQLTDDFYRSIQGESVTGDVYEEFYVDETALYELMLEVFYNKVY